MAFKTSHISTDTGAQLFVKKTTVLVVAIRTFHRSFRHLVVERFGEGGFLLGMAGEAKVRLGIFEQKFSSKGCLAAPLGPAMTIQRGRFVDALAIWNHLSV